MLVRNLLQSRVFQICRKFASNFRKKLVAFRTTVSMLSATVCLKRSVTAAGDRYGSGHVLSFANGILALRRVRAAAKRQQVDVTGCAN